MMNKSSNEAFFSLCEYYLSDPETSPNFLHNFNEKIIYITVRYLGVIGMILAYVAIVVRDSETYLSCFRSAAVLDIKAKLILKRNEIKAECRTVSMRRRHLPSRQILGEIRIAHRRYVQLRRGSDSNKSVSARSAMNEMYLFWLLYFYVHRSIILANADKIKSEIRSVVTIEEYTPLFAGYLSAFYDLDVPLILYLPVKLTLPKLTLQALPFYFKVIVKNGSDADFLQKNGNVRILLEEPEPFHHRTSNDHEHLFAGVFLASFYTLNDADLAQFLLQSTIPYLRRFQKLWQPLHIRVFCHPNDDRARGMLEQAGFDVEERKTQNNGRMTGFDVVISGNSSVIDEALAAEIPVIYCGTLDRYRYDLMGYVKEGLVLDGTYECPTQSMAADFFGRIQTRIRQHRYIRGVGGHQSVRLADAIEIVA